MRKTTIADLTIVLAILSSTIGARSDDLPDTAAPRDLIPHTFERLAQALRAIRDDPLSPLPDSFRLYRSRFGERHAAALGVPVRHTPQKVEWRSVATLERRGYSIHKIVFESAPGLPVPALLYVPGGLKDRAPAVLNVHGHWSEAKCAPPVQSPCVALAMRGFVCLSFDAIGAGERAYQGITYHGRRLGYQILPSGLTLAGLQVLDNRRAIDLLSSLPQVDPERIGVTGASGGGNQTFHLSILDDRVKAAVAVCFFGAYEGYLRGAHCACELVPGALTYSEEGDAAGWVAPRALKLLAAKEDGGAAFQIADARRNAERASRLYQKAGAAGKFELEEFEGGHDYSKPMRESMAAFFETHLKGAPRSGRVPEPELDLLAPEELRVFPDGKLPGGAEHVPQIAARLAGERIADLEKSGLSWRDGASRQQLRERLQREVFGISRLEPDARLDVEWDPAAPGSGETMEGVLVVLGPGPKGLERPRRWAIARVEPSGTGATRWPGASAVECDDYVLAQGSAVLGQPILGRWVREAQQAVETARARHPRARIALLGEGALALAALLAGALEDKVDAVGAVDLLSSYAWPDRFDDRWPLSIFVPGLLRCGDVAQIASAMAGRSLVIAAPRDGGGKVIDAAGEERFTRLMGGAWNDFAIVKDGDAQRLLERTIDRLVSTRRGG